MKRRRLGQHYLVDDDAVDRLVSLARIEPSEGVLEIGTGKGAVTKRLIGEGASFEGYEVDRQNYKDTMEAIRGTRARLHLADAFEQRPRFDVLVSSLPYSESSRFVQWLSGAEFDRAVVVLQEDFVRKIMAPPGDRDYRGVSAIAQVAFDVKVLDRVGRSSFAPPPRVNSVIVSFEPKRKLTESEVAGVQRLFSLRRKQVGAALAKLGVSPRKDYGRRRIYGLKPAEVLEVCRQLTAA